MRYLCIREELSILSKKTKKLVVTDQDGPLFKLFCRLKTLEEKLWKPILEEHSASNSQQRFDSSDHPTGIDYDYDGNEDENEEDDCIETESEQNISTNSAEVTYSSQITNAVNTEFTAEGANTTRNKFQNYEPGMQDEKHPFQISGSGFGRRQNVVGKRRISVTRKAKKSSSKKLKQKSFLSSPFNRPDQTRPDSSDTRNMSRTSPNATWSIRLIQVPLWFLSKLLPTHEFLRRPQDHVRFDEVLNALIYWNPSFTFFPRSFVAARSDLDQTIVQTVAQQLISGLLSGIAIRFRASKRRKEAEKSTEEPVEKSDENSAIVLTGENSFRFETNSEIFPSSWIEAARFWEKEEEESTSRGLLARILIQRKVSLNDLYTIGNDQGLDLKLQEDIFEDEQIADVLCTDPRLAPACNHVRAREIALRLLKAGHEKLLKLYAEAMGFDVSSAPNVAEISGEELLSLLKIKPIQAKIEEIDGPAGSDENENLDQALHESILQLEDHNIQLTKIMQERDQLLAVVTEARARYASSKAENDKIVAALRVQGIKIEVDHEESDPSLSDDQQIKAGWDAYMQGNTELMSPEFSQSNSEFSSAASKDEIKSSRAKIAENAKLRDAIAIKRAQLQRLQEQLKISKMREASVEKTAQSPKEVEVAALASRQARLQRQMDRRQQVSGPSNAASKSGLSAMGIEGPKISRYSKAKAEKASAGNQRVKLPAWL